MASFNSINLPIVPSDLKNVSPFVQRANELHTRDPVMAYWCLYFAAQTGLSMKSQQPGAKEFLLALITQLETMKRSIGVNDAVDNESAGAAYVENFALRVFTSADSEDRAAKATKSTAKKFLAAANFLQIMSIFDKTDTGNESIDKIRYAQWRAAEISKAIREGRDPSEGFNKTTSDNEVASTSLHPTSLEEGNRGDDTESANLFQNASTVSTRSHAPTIPRINLDSSNDFVDYRITADNPGNWSTLATPGSEAVFQHSDGLDFVSAAVGDLENNNDSLSRNEQYAGGGIEMSDERPAMTTASTIGRQEISTTESTVTNAAAVGQGSSIVASSLKNVQFNAPVAKPTPPQTISQPTPSETDSALTPTQIAKAQKHCRFAISALEYDDAEQARKDLRAALAILGDI